MISILEVLRTNEKEAIEILKGKENMMVTFAEWDDDEEVYSNADDCPYIRYCDDDGFITSQLVVSVRYNEEKKGIEIITTEDEYSKTDGDWFSIRWCDDISFWEVLERIAES